MPPNWERFLAQRCTVASLDLTLDYSRMLVAPGFFDSLRPQWDQALADMRALEAGALANPDERRMVGHYWLRAPDRAPTPALGNQIRTTLDRVRRFAADVHAGRVAAPDGARFTHVLSIGIGGSALGPMFLADALGQDAGDRVRLHFFDNTDPQGFERVLAAIGENLPHTLTLVLSKSGATPETRNGMVRAAAAYRAAGVAFARCAAAITGEGSQLDRQAQSEGWLERFPMWDWVGGRTSVTSAVGLLPAALQGIDIDALLAGAAACDESTRTDDVHANPAALLALLWHHAGGGRGARDMVVLPYKDRLQLLGRYLQQLVMESLGKRLDRAGRRVDQGLAVYGNKGSTDQHAYVQQLRDGLDNFFVTFIRVLETGGPRIEVQPGIDPGDYLHGFWLGTREALHANQRASMTITIPRVDARSVGALIALFERAVGFYASLIGVNAYDQPGVEAGKKAAAAALELQQRIVAALTDQPQTASQIAARLDAADVETVFLLLDHLAATRRASVFGSSSPATAAFARPLA